MLAKIRINADVKTPNGPGVLFGRFKEDNQWWGLVYHEIKKMTGNSAGRNITPRGRVSCLVEYMEGDIS